MWVVKLLRSNAMILNTYNLGYFPRKFIYQSDAQKLALEIQRLGGVAIINLEKSNASQR